jgi:phenylpropionate dioxygenase-like ring-hydroxylating dioxygenase large terminal subunit
MASTIPRSIHAQSSEGSVDYSLLVQEGRVHGSLYTSEAVFHEEMDKIFQGGWTFVAHESEVPNPGDYVTRRVGTQSIIVLRDKDGDYLAFYNRCPHRGATICSSRSGRQARLTCPYHGWTFALDGRLIGVPYPAAYPQTFERATLGLRSVARCQSYGGFIFVSLGAEDRSLDDHLGNAKSLIDDLLALSPLGRIRLTGGWMKHRIRSNWKILFENQIDGYHVHVVHGSLLASNKTFTSGRDRTFASPTRVRDFGDGHVDIDHGSDYRAIDKPLLWMGRHSTHSYQEYVGAMTASYGESEARRRLVNGPPHSMLFPNLSLAEMNIIFIEPVGPGESIAYTTPVLLEGAEELNQRTLRRCEGALGPAGFLIADDAEIAELTQRGLNNMQPEWIELTRGIDQEEVREDGSRIAGLMDETGQRGFWRHYRNVMAAPRVARP